MSHAPSSSSSTLARSTFASSLRRRHVAAPRDVSARRTPPRRAVTTSAHTAEQLKTLKMTTTKLRECAKRGAASTAVDLLVGLGAQGVTPDATCATACISACVNGSNMELAQKVYDEIFEKGVCVPDEVAVAEIAKGYLKLDPPGWGRAMQLVNGARQKYGVEPSSVTYNVLLSTCAATNDLMRAEEIVDRMVDEDVPADGYTLKAVEKRRSIRAYVRKMLLVDRDEVWEE